MVSVGLDKRAIVWKIPQETQLIYKERFYSLDSVLAIDSKHFVTSSQDGYSNFHAAMCAYTASTSLSLSALSRICTQAAGLGQ